MKKNRELPQGVYKTRNKKVQAIYWDRKDKKLKDAGTYSCADEAEYNYWLKKDGHHWRQNDESGTAFGFIYLITNKATGKRYVGSKQFIHYCGPPGGYKCSDRTSDWFEPAVWKESDWKDYVGSSKPLNREMADGNRWDYTFEIICFCKNKLDLHLAEVDYMIEHDVLEAVDENGDYLWYNENIASKEFRAPFRKVDVTAAQAKTMEKMKRYYVKPQFCSCGAMIPFGGSPCCTPAKKKKIVEKGGFDDVR